MKIEKELTRDEAKAKENTDFYYFWLFHYCGRNYHMELNKRFSPDIDVYTPETLQRTRDMADNIYWAHPLSAMHPQFTNSDDDVLDVDTLFHDLGIPSELPATLLEKLYFEEEIDRPFTWNNGYGVEILGTSGAHISTDEYIRSSLITKIDLRASTSAILYEISKIRETKFERFPDFLDAPPFANLQGDYLHQNRIIKQTTGSSFSAKDDAARALGLWFWDSIEGPYAFTNSFADVWRVICGQAVQGITVNAETQTNAFFYNCP